MGRVSRRRIEPIVEERMFNLFWQLLASLAKPAEIREFLASLLSYTEQVMLAKRLAIALLISKGYTYEKVSSILKVSTATVSIVHKALLIGYPGYKKALSLLKKQAETEAFWDNLEELLLKLSLPAAYGSLQFRRKSEIGKRLYKRKRFRSVI